MTIKSWLEKYFHCLSLYHEAAWQRDDNKLKLKYGLIFEFSYIFNSFHESFVSVPFSVDSKNVFKDSRGTIEKKLSVPERITIAKWDYFIYNKEDRALYFFILKEFAFSDSKSEAVKSAFWKLLNSFPSDLVQHSTNIEHHSVPALTWR